MAEQNIREVIGRFIGKRLIEITQHDKDEKPFVCLMFEDGDTLTFPITDEGFNYDIEE